MSLSFTITKFDEHVIKHTYKYINKISSFKSAKVDSEEVPQIKIWVLAGKSINKKQKQTDSFIFIKNKKYFFEKKN